MTSPAASPMKSSTSLTAASSSSKNCWPWMKGVVDLTKTHGQSKKKNGIKNNNDKDGLDQRPVIQDLIDENRELIDKLKARLEEWASYGSSALVLDPNGKHDDFWCLRFLLSHKKNLEKATKAACTTLDFRHKHSIDHWGDIRHLPPQDVVGGNEGKTAMVKEEDNDEDDSNRGGDDGTAAARASAGFAKFVGCGGVADHSIVFKVWQKENHMSQQEDDKSKLPPDTVVTYIDIGKLDTHVLGSSLDVDDWVAGLTYVNEYNYQWLDYISRTTGRLTKSIRIVNIGTASIGQVDFSCQQSYTKAVAQMEDCYPQAVSQIFVCFAPSWIYLPWKAIKPLLPQRVVSKMDFLHPIKNHADLQTILTKVPKSMLPVTFGGTNTTIFPTKDGKKTDNEEEEPDDEDDFVDAAQPDLE